MKVFSGQPLQLVVAAAFAFGLAFLLNRDPMVAEGEWFGLSTEMWYWTAFLVPIVHQIYVAVCWRLELHYKKLTKWFGKRGFTLYKIGFALLILSRPLSIIALAIANQDTLQLPSAVAYLCIVLLAVPAVYLFYSVRKYFGIDRAFGIDHFNPEEASKQPMVKEGIFKLTSNGMYVYGFLALYIPGFIWYSKAALILALYNHLYIWTHYYCTERPDMEHIYK